jgi:serine phosphatase RsbU (regulator of sigma subunit)
MLYTDGIVEQPNLENELYGEDRLRNQLAGDHADGPQEILDAIINDVKAYAGDLPAQDDQAVIIAFIE